MADARFDSESSRYVADATTSSPGLRPLAISTSESVRTPTVTARGTKAPSPRFTKTRFSVPVGSTAPVGTVSVLRPAGAVEHRDLVCRNVPQGESAARGIDERAILQPLGREVLFLGAYEVGRIDRE